MQTPASIPPLRLSVRSADAPIELIAESVRRRCLQMLGIESLPLPIPIDTWIEHPLEYRLSVVDEREIGAGVLGMARPSTGEILISETLLEHEGRYRFTCAHELGHLVLHAGGHSQFRDVEVPHDAGAEAVEREADRFAAAFLMPLETMSAALESVLAEGSLSRSCLTMLRGDDVVTVWLWRRCFLPVLCARYAVSRAAMAFRCRELRLPGQRRLVRPSLVPLLAAPERALRDLPLDAVELRDGIPVLGD